MRRLLVTFKRLALLAGGEARALTSGVLLTPQRCDLIYALRERPMIQRDLAFELGVVRSVVSKMVTALEKLGLVQRRGVEGDRRLRLVTLTQRAFDMMSLLVMRGASAAKGYTIQFAAEEHLLQHFRKDLVAAKVGVEARSDRNQRPVLTKMRLSIAKLLPYSFVVAARDPIVAEWRDETLAMWRTTTPTWTPLEKLWPDDPLHASEILHSSRHRDAGIPLDFWQRFPPRRRGRRATPTPTALETTDGSRDGNDD